MLFKKEKTKKKEKREKKAAEEQLQGEEKGVLPHPEDFLCTPLIFYELQRMD